MLDYKWSSLLLCLFPIYENLHDPVQIPPPLWGCPSLLPMGSVLSTPFSLCTNSVAHPQPIVPSPRIPVCLPSTNSWDCLRITTATVDLYFSILLNIAWYRVAQLINRSHWSSFSTSRTFCIFLH